MRINPFGQIARAINLGCLGGRLLLEGLDNKNRMDGPSLTDSGTYYGKKENIRDIFLDYKFTRPRWSYTRQWAHDIFYNPRHWRGQL